MNYYQVLDVPPDATPEDIKQAYRRLVRKHHPDVAGEVDRDLFHQIQTAYETLSDSGERRKYDLSVGWGRSPRTAIPYRPDRTKTSSSKASNSNTTNQAAHQPKPAQSASARSGASKPTSSQSSKTQPGSNQTSSSSTRSSGFKSAKSGAATRAATSMQPEQPPYRPAGSASAASEVNPPGSFSREATNQDSKKGRTTYRDNGYRPPGYSPDGVARHSTAHGNSRNGSASSHQAKSAAAGNSNNSAKTNGAPNKHRKPYSPPPRPEPEVQTFNQGLKSLKEALRKNRYSEATEIADRLVANYPKQPLALRMFVKAYHLRGNEMLYYKRYELAEIYLYEALKTAHFHYPELVSTIQDDLERMEINRRELDLI